MSRINRLPLGLQDFLGTQQFGENPDEILRVIQPTLELSSFIAAGRLDGKRTSITVSNPMAASLTISQPSGELWIPLSFGVGILGNNDAGTSWGACFQIRNAALPSTPGTLALTFAAPPQVTPSVTTGEQNYVAFTPPQPMPMRGPVEWRALISPYTSGGTGNDTFEFTMIILKLKI